MGFWEIAPIIIQIAQMYLHLSALDTYRKKLEELADWLSMTADKERIAYESFRDADPAFYDYYKSLPDYAICKSAVKRNKGEAFYKYGAKTRRKIRTTRGFSPLSRVTVNTAFSSQAVHEAAVARAVTYIRERKRRDNHTLERWSAIVSAPVAVERYQAQAVNNITSSSFRSMKGFARGFNSAGMQLGTSLFRVLN